MECGAVWKSKWSAYSRACTIKANMKSERYWLLANILGVCAYLFIEYLILAPRFQEDALNTFDVMHLWLTLGCPLLIAFLIVDLVWLAIIIKGRRSGGNWRPMTPWVLVSLAWGLAIYSYGIAPGMVKLLIIAMNRKALH